jgi:hypothetical protein
MNFRLDFFPQSGKRSYPSNEEGQMAERKLHIEASEETLQKFQNKLKSDPELIKALSNNPKATLHEYGIQIDDITASSIKTQLTNTKGDQPALVVGPTIAVAVAVGPAVALVL